MKPSAMIVYFGAQLWGVDSQWVSEPAVCAVNPHVECQLLIVESEWVSYEESAPIPEVPEEETPQE